MSSTWMEDTAIESSDPLLDDYAEDDSGAIGGESAESYAGDPLGDAESRSRNARRARARRIALARSRAARAQSARNGSAQPRTVAAAVREVDLANKVQADAVGGALAAQGKRIDRSELAVMAGIVERQLETSFPGIAENRILAAGLRGAPLLLLKPTRREGLGGYASHPQVLGAALIAGLAFAGEMSRKSQEVSEVRITRSERELPVNGSIRFRADALDERGRVIGEKRQSITWTSGNPDVATVDASGVVTALKPGNVTIKASGERSELFDHALVTVNGAVA